MISFGKEYKPDVFNLSENSSNSADPEKIISKPEHDILEKLYEQFEGLETERRVLQIEIDAIDAIVSYPEMPYYVELQDDKKDKMLKLKAIEAEKTEISRKVNEIIK